MRRSYKQAVPANVSAMVWTMRQKLMNSCSILYSKLLELFEKIDCSSLNSRQIKSTTVAPERYPRKHKYIELSDEDNSGLQRQIQ